MDDTLEVRVQHPNCLWFQVCRLGDRRATMRDLVRHALRHRPDHIVVSEVRGTEPADLLLGHQQRTRRVTVSVRDSDEHENRWIVDPSWPLPIARSKVAGIGSATP